MKIKWKKAGHEMAIPEEWIVNRNNRKERR